ncbi:hypothetical protein N480_25470 [Pseudoalteromonas luteoviolacea S2607]|uniref:cupin-like domain-containing protein n=1 Tax=Pseudoalteromonas luteoviolacea TaxID=43657 RepID=UPI0007B09319|nr:cupin-like domain-containing protein [Pseudoalteromonas luteoviolacea]KZN32602.1 hypothetical protein N480_25470 [Pseudoalteromonas luteoviolacea S2607]
MEKWRELNIEPIERVELSRIDFLERYRFNKPVIAKADTSRNPGFKNWSLEYLEEKIGDATIKVSEYSEESNKHQDARPKQMSFREFSQKFRDKDIGANWYWFNVSESGNFWTNEKFKEKFNEEISILAEDYEAPAFLRQSELINAQIILGSESNATPMHYDYAGEAKSLTQVKGRKHCLLVAPDQAHLLNLNSMYDFQGRPNYSTVDIRNLDPEKHPELRELRLYEAVLEEGEALYWPNFWLHDIKNLDKFTLAISSSLDELPGNALMRRYSAAATLSGLVNQMIEQQEGISMQDLVPILMAAKGLEARLLKPLPNDKSSFWDWRPELSQKVEQLLIAG